MSSFETVRAILNEFSNPYGMRLNTQGIMLAKAGRYQEAEEFFRQAIDLSPSLPLPRMNLANILQMQFNFREAERYLKEAQKFPNYDLNKENILYTLGNCYYHQVKIQDAIENYEKAKGIRKSPFPDIQGQLAKCYVLLGEWEKAKEEIEQVKEFVIPSDATILHEDFCNLRDVIEAYLRAPLFSYKPKPLKFSACATQSLREDTQKALSRPIDFSQPKVFLVGAGISYPSPTNLPLAVHTTWNIFNMMFELDKDGICEIFNTNESEALFDKIKEELRDEKYFPFEPSFEALTDAVGYRGIRFVDTLRGGDPNVNHFMLAHAIRSGHLVITVNFDNHIERAYQELFPDEKLNVLTTDEDFKNLVEKESVIEGILAKIHGTLDDYNSIGLTLDQVTRSSDGTFQYDSSFSKRLLLEQQEIHYPRSTLSAPKALFFQKALQSAQTIILGYSNSDIFDIQPFLESIEFGWQGLLIDHVNSTECEILSSIKDNPARLHLKTDTSKFSNYCLSKLGTNYSPSKSNTIHETRWPEAFEQWVRQMRLVKGDGLFWLGRLFSQRGHWARAESLYAKAASEFKDEFTEKWLSSRISLSFVKNASGSQDSSILLDLKEYIENNNLHSLYKSHYSTVLLNIAANMFTTEFKGDLTNVKRLIKEGLRYGQESLSGANLSHAFELLGDVLFTERDYQAALKNYMTAYNLVTNQSGDILTTISVLLSSAKCLSHLNQEDAAFELLEQAKILAQRFENKELQYRVFLAYQSNLKWNSVLYLDIMNDALRTSNENEKGSFLRDMEDCHKTIFDYLDNPSESSFNQIQTELDLLGRNRYSPPLLSYIRFLKSNLHLFHLKLNRRIIAFHHAPDSFKKQIDEIHLNFNPMTYDRTLNKINSLLEEYHNLPSVRKDLLFFKSNIFRRKGLYQKEIEVLQNYVEIFPDDDPIIEHNLGVAWLNLSKYNSAKEHLLKAIDLMDGLYPLAIYNLCKTCIYLKDYEVAKYQKERLRKLGVPDSWLRDLPV